MRIRRVEEADFRKSEYSIFVEFNRRNVAFVKQLSAADVVVFLSKSGNQLLFMHGFCAVGSGTSALMSIKHRLIGGTWNPLRLANYAKDAGLDIQGLKFFEEHYRELVEDSRPVKTKKAA